MTIAALSAAIVLMSTASTAGRVAAPVASSTPVPPLTIFPRVGNPVPSRIEPHGPGLVLMGGGATVDPAFVWMHDTIVGAHGVRGGDVVVLTASSGDIYSPYLMAVAPFNSVRSIQIAPSATPDDLRKAASFVDRAQGVFFSGGDQAHYVKWKGTALSAAVQRVYDRGGVVGGTSAGLAILGEYVFDSVAADAAGDETNVMTSNAVRDPSESIISFTQEVLSLPPLRRTITDTHVVTRNRLGRLVVFLARLRASTSDSLLGLGIEQGSAIVVDRHGIGTLELEHHRGDALLVRLTRSTFITRGKPFQARDVSITLLDRDGQQVDFNTWCARAPTYHIDVDGSKPPYYRPGNPYATPINARDSRCP